MFHIIECILHKRRRKIKRETAFNVVAESPESHEAHCQYDKSHDGHADVQDSHGRCEPIGLFHFQLQRQYLNL